MSLSCFLALEGIWTLTAVPSLSSVLAGEDAELGGTSKKPSSRKSKLKGNRPNPRSHARRQSLHLSLTTTDEDSSVPPLAAISPLSVVKSSKKVKHASSKHLKTANVYIKGSRTKSPSFTPPALPRRGFLQTQRARSGSSTATPQPVTHEGAFAEEARAVVDFTKSKKRGKGKKKSKAVKGPSTPSSVLQPDDPDAVDVPRNVEISGNPFESSFHPVNVKREATRTASPGALLGRLPFEGQVSHPSRPMGGNPFTLSTIATDLLKEEAPIPIRVPVPFSAASQTGTSTNGRKTHRPVSQSTTPAPLGETVRSTVALRHPVKAGMTSSTESSGRNSSLEKRKRVEDQVEDVGEVVERKKKSARNAKATTTSISPSSSASNSPPLSTFKKVNPPLIKVEPDDTPPLSLFSAESASSSSKGKSALPPYLAGPRWFMPPNSFYYSAYQLPQKPVLDMKGNFTKPLPVFPPGGGCVFLPRFPYSSGRNADGGCECFCRLNEHKSMPLLPSSVADEEEIQYIGEISRNF